MASDVLFVSSSLLLKPKRTNKRLLALIFIFKRIMLFCKFSKYVTLLNVMRTGRGHGALWQYPDEFGRVLQTFLTTTADPSG